MAFLYTFSHPWANASSFMRPDASFRWFSTEIFHKVKHTIIPLCWETHFWECFQLHERRCALKDGFGPVLYWSQVSATFLMLSTQPCKRFHHHDRSYGLKDAFYPVFSPTIKLMALSLSFNTQGRKPWLIHSSWGGFDIVFYLHRLGSQN